MSTLEQLPPWLIDYMLDQSEQGKDVNLRETLRNSSLLGLIQKHYDKPPTITVYKQPGPRVPAEPLRRAPPPGKRK